MKKLLLLSISTIAFSASSFALTPGPNDLKSDTLYTSVSISNIDITGLSYEDKQKELKGLEVIGEIDNANAKNVAELRKYQARTKEEVRILQSIAINSTHFDTMNRKNVIQGVIDFLNSSEGREMQKSGNFLGGELSFIRDGFLIRYFSTYKQINKDVGIDVRTGSELITSKAVTQMLIEEFHAAKISDTDVKAQSSDLIDYSLGVQ